MNKMKRKVIAFAAVVSLLASVPVYASSKTEVENKKSALESELSGVQSDISDMEAAKTKLQESIAELDGEMEEITLKIVDLNQKIEEKESEIETTQENLSEAQANEEKQYENMKKRIKFMYESGSSELIEMLLAAEDISDLLNKVEYISKISEYDRDMLTRYQETKHEIADLEVQLAEENEELKASKEDYTLKQEEIENKIEEKKTKISEYIASIDDAEEAAWLYEMEIEDQKNLLAQIAEQDRIAAQKAQESESKAQETESQTTAQTEGQTSEQTSSQTESQTSQQTETPQTQAPEEDTAQTETPPTSTGSSLIWPLPGYSTISSGFGNRESPGGIGSTNHKGIDIPAATGTAIVAAAGGTAYTGYSDSTGYYVTIDHGNGIVTVYYHCSAFAISGGTVSTGQTIAYVGSTGNSTGPHLHFGVIVNGVYQNPLNYVSP